MVFVAGFFMKPSNKSTRKRCRNGKNIKPVKRSSNGKLSKDSNDITIHSNVCRMLVHFTLGGNNYFYATTTLPSQPTETKTVENIFKVAKYLFNYIALIKTKFERKLKHVHTSKTTAGSHSRLTKYRIHAFSFETDATVVLFICFLFVRFWLVKVLYFTVS